LAKRESLPFSIERTRGAFAGAEPETALVQREKKD
jgi:hypothetical protein